MSVYTRFKRAPGGFRNLVELLETTPMSRRQRMIDVGMEEDPDYTKKALEYVMTFEDIIHLPDMELAEVLAKAPPRMTAYSLFGQSEEIKIRFIKNAIPQVSAQIRDYLQIKIGLREAGGAQLKMIETARQLEKGGLIKCKRIPI